MRKVGYHAEAGLLPLLNDAFSYCLGVLKVYKQKFFVSTGFGPIYFLQRKTSNIEHVLFRCNILTGTVRRTT